MGNSNIILYVLGPSAIFVLILYLIIIPSELIPVPGGHFWGFLVLGGLGLIVTIIHSILKKTPFALTPWYNVFKFVKWGCLIGSIIYLIFILFNYSPLIKPILSGDIEGSIDVLINDFQKTFDEVMAIANEYGIIAQDQLDKTKDISKDI